MQWLVFLIIGQFIWSVTALVDSFALQNKIKSKELYVLFPSFVQIFVATVLVFIFGFSLPSNIFIIFLALSAGLLEVAKLYFIFTALALEEVSRVFPLISLTPFVTFFLAYIFLGEVLFGNQLIAFLLFIAGGFFLAFKYDTRVAKSVLSKGIKPLIIVSLVSSIEFILLKLVFEGSDFWTGLYISRIGLFFGGILLLAVGFKRKDIFLEWKSLTARIKFLLIGNQTLATFGHVFIFLAISLGSVSVISSAGGIQNIMIFVMATLLTLKNKDLLKETVDIKNLVQKTLGISLILLAIFFLNI